VFGTHICVCSDGYTNFDGICDYQRKPQVCYCEARFTHPFSSLMHSWPVFSVGQ
jgi:hypothetical protein